MKDIVWPQLSGCATHFSLVKNMLINFCAWIVVSVSCLLHCLRKKGKTMDRPMPAQEIFLVCITEEPGSQRETISRGFQNKLFSKKCHAILRARRDSNLVWTEMFTFQPFTAHVYIVPVHTGIWITPSLHFNTREG